MLVYDFRTMGNKLLHFRKKQGKTQIEVAEEAGLSDRTYADIERGKVNMRIETLIKICDVLHITPNDILTEEITYSDNDREMILASLEQCSPRVQATALELLNVYMKSANS